MIMRRTLVAAVPLATPLGLAACAGMTVPQTIALVARDADRIATGLSTAVDRIAALNLSSFTPEILALCQKALAGVRSVAAALAVATSIPEAQPLAMRLEGYVNALLAALSFVTLPPDVQQIVTAATVLMPVILSMVDIVISRAAPPAGMTADQARTALK